MAVLAFSYSSCTHLEPSVRLKRTPVHVAIGLHFPVQSVIHTHACIGKNSLSKTNLHEFLPFCERSEQIASEQRKTEKPGLSSRASRARSPYKKGRSGTPNLPLFIYLSYFPYAASLLSRLPSRFSEIITWRNGSSPSLRVVTYLSFCSAA